jgi:hypothetical protein
VGPLINSILASSPLSRVREASPAVNGRIGGRRGCLHGLEWSGHGVSALGIAKVSVAWSTSSAKWRSGQWEATFSYAGRDANPRLVSTNQICGLAGLRSDLREPRFVLYSIIVYRTGAPWQISTEALDIDPSFSNMLRPRRL